MGERKQQQNHIVSTKGGTLVTSHQGGNRRRGCRARGTRERERGHQDRRHGHAADVAEGVPAALRRRQRLLPARASRSTSATRSSSSRRLPHRRLPGARAASTLAADRTRPAPTSGAVDAAGAPFWFNGQPTSSASPRRSARQGSTARSYVQRRQARQSAACRWREKPKPFTVKFTKTGTFTYYCNIHAGHEGHGQGHVQGPQRSRRAKADAKTLAGQVATALSTAKTLTKTQVAGRTRRRRRRRQARRGVFAIRPGDRRRSRRARR